MPSQTLRSCKAASLMCLVTYAASNAQQLDQSVWQSMEEMTTGKAAIDHLPELAQFAPARDRAFGTTAGVGPGLAADEYISILGNATASDIEAVASEPLTQDVLAALKSDPDAQVLFAQTMEQLQEQPEFRYFSPDEIAEAWLASKALVTLSDDGSQEFCLLWIWCGQGQPLQEERPLLPSAPGEIQVE